MYFKIYRCFHTSYTMKDTSWGPLVVAFPPFSYRILCPLRTPGSTSTFMFTRRLFKAPVFSRPMILKKVASFVIPVKISSSVNGSGSRSSPFFVALGIYDWIALCLWIDEFVLGQTLHGCGIIRWYWDCNLLVSWARGYSSGFIWRRWVSNIGVVQRVGCYYEVIAECVLECWTRPGPVCDRSWKTDDLCLSTWEKTTSSWVKVYPWQTVTCIVILGCRRILDTNRCIAIWGVALFFQHRILCFWCRWRRRSTPGGWNYAFRCVCGTVCSFCRTLGESLISLGNLKRK